MEQDPLEDRAGERDLRAGLDVRRPARVLGHHLVEEPRAGPVLARVRVSQQGVLDVNDLKCKVIFHPWTLQISFKICTWIVVDSRALWQAAGREPDLRPVLFRLLQVRGRRHPDVPEIRGVPAHERGGEEPRPGLPPRSHGEGLPLPLYPIPVNGGADLVHSWAKIDQNRCPFPPLNTSSSCGMSKTTKSKRCCWLVLFIQVLLIMG